MPFLATTLRKLLAASEARYPAREIFEVKGAVHAAADPVVLAAAGNQLQGAGGRPDARSFGVLSIRVDGRLGQAGAPPVRP